MRRVLAAVLIAALGVVAVGRPTVVSGTEPTHSKRADSLLSLMRSSSCVQGFVLEGPEQISDKEGPNLHGSRIVRLGPVASSAQVEKLCQLVEKSAVAPCGEPKPCEFDPGFGLRFILPGEPLDVLIGKTCDSWLFMHGDRRVSGVTYDTDCIGYMLKELMTSMFESGTRK